MIERKIYLEKLIRKQWNGRIKIVTGIRRCGKSTLLFDLFTDYLRTQGVLDNQIIAVALDDDQNADLRNPDHLSSFVREKASDRTQKYYVLIDEIQYAISKEELKQEDRPIRLYSVLNGFLHLKNIDVYVTGSNSKMLSKDISTEFRGRGDVIHMYPLSFGEYYAASNLDKQDAYNEYSMYGGMPYLLKLDEDEDKFDYLSNLFEEIYFKDIEERYTIALPSVLKSLTDDLCSSVGSLTNASKIARTLQSTQNIHVNPETISNYLNYLTESFLFSKADRYDVKGKKYFEYPSKYYCTDVGLRNVRLGLRQQEETHIMENMIYNELLVRGMHVDVGVVPVSEKTADGKYIRKNCEIDFVANKGYKRYYIQSALNMDYEEKEQSELRPLKSVQDSFKKIVVSKSYGKSWIDEDGILRINLIDFLLDPDSLDR
ncbi:ATP-binding protein [Grylomicrobium aquisgranensis]|uniref:ATP-binding protein n=1 Tax=Grylomicrobium aquisgranensis TaxID=2926318 RepID=UPI00351C161B